MHAEDLGERLS